MSIKKIIAVIFTAVTVGSCVYSGAVTGIANTGLAAGAEGNKLIALTFDDGPNTTTTNEVLDILAEYDAKASFFLIGQNINEQSAVTVKRAYDMGMEINNHSKTHSNMSKMSPEEIKVEVDFVDEKVMEIIGEKTKFFRPPFIDVSQVMYDNIDLPFICGIDCQDYMPNVGAQERADYILNGVKDGVIVLLHDAAGNDQTVEALKIAMPILKEQGYEFVTLTELFEHQGETPRDNILYSRVAKYPCSDYTLHSKLFSGTTDKIPLDRALLKQLGETYAIELDYTASAGYPPVVALQCWSTQPSLWYAVQPSYSNGEKAVFLACDILSAMEQLETDYDALDGLTVSAYGGEVTLSDAKILVRGEQQTEPRTILTGDTDFNGKIDVIDLVCIKRIIKGGTDDKEAFSAADVNGDGSVTSEDIWLLQRFLTGRTGSFSVVDNAV